jgi:hypothetical protein
VVCVRGEAIVASLRETLQQDFEAWRQERDVVEKEMNRLITSILSGAKEDRDIRRAQFQALIERREAAARKVLPPLDLAKRLKAEAQGYAGSPDA